MAWIDDAGLRMLKRSCTPVVMPEYDENNDDFDTPLYLHPLPESALRALVEAASKVIADAPSDEVLIAVGRDDGVRNRPCPLNNVTDGAVLDLRAALAQPELLKWLGRKS